MFLTSIYVKYMFWCGFFNVMGGWQMGWSDLVIKHLDTFLKSYEFNFPVFSKSGVVKFAPGNLRGSDCIISVDYNGKKRTLLIEIEQYASGKGHHDKLLKWAINHFNSSESDETTTFVIGLLLPALRNRLVNHKEELVYKMVFSSQFRMFPGVGDGTLSNEFIYSLTSWLDDCYKS